MKWITSVRSLMAVMIMFTWCLAFIWGMVEPDVFGATVSAVTVLYFTAKKRKEDKDGMV